MKTSLEKVAFRRMLHRGGLPYLWDFLDALFSRDLTKLDKMLAEGADINMKDERGWTPLYFAVEYDDLDAVNEVRPSIWPPTLSRLPTNPSATSPVLTPLPRWSGSANQTPSNPWPRVAP